jgi:hypothetical protein
VIGIGARRHRAGLHFAQLGPNAATVHRVQERLAENDEPAGYRQPSTDELTDVRPLPPARASSVNRSSAMSRT